MNQSNLPEEWESEPPVESPDGWHGGQVEHTGGNIFCRTWRTVKDYPDTDADEFLEAGYDEDFLGVSISRYVRDEELGHIFDSVVEERGVSDGSDKTCAEMAVRLMEEHNPDKD